MMDKVFLPFLGYVLSLAEYLLIPNVRENENSYRYAVLLSFAILLYAVFLCIGYYKKNKGKEKLFCKIENKAPIFFAVYLFLALFDILTLKLGVLSYPFIPYVNDIINAAIGDYKMLFKSLFYSLRLLFTSYIIGSILGVITGVFSGFSKKVRYWVEPVLNFLAPIPPATWIPLAMILAKSLFSGSVFIIALGVWFSVSIYTTLGVVNVKKEYIDSGRILGAKELQIILQVVIPSALPSIFDGLSSGMMSACVTLIIAEMMGVEAGLGWYIEWAKAWAMFNRMFAAIIFICIVFNLVNLALKKTKKYFLRWNNAN